MLTAIIQPNYIPWRGHFDFFKKVDTFVFYDDVQYTKRDWRNRNTIKTPDGGQLLTVPVDADRDTLICDAKIVDNGWKQRHLDLISQNYKNAPYFGDAYGIMCESFDEIHEDIGSLTISITQKILDYFGINCRIYRSSELGFEDLHKTDRLVAICKKVGATEYISGMAAKDYLKPEKFGDIRVLWQRYNEKVYPQLWGDFMSRVSIIDLIANCGIKGYEII